MGLGMVTRRCLTTLCDRLVQMNALHCLPMQDSYGYLLWNWNTVGGCRFALEQ
jgi:hypothetical protein